MHIASSKRSEITTPHATGPLRGSLPVGLGEADA